MNDDPDFTPALEAAGVELPKLIEHLEFDDDEFRRQVGLALTRAWMMGFKTGTVEIQARLISMGVSIPTLGLNILDPEEPDNES